MKKLFIGLIAVISAVSIQAQPLAQNATIITQPGQPLVSGTLSQLAQGGVQPYNFAAMPPFINGTLNLNNDGSFNFQIISLPAYFHYRITDRNGHISNIGTIAIISAPTQGISEVEAEAG